MEQYGSTATYNVESVLRKNIVDSEYFRDTCGKLDTWDAVVDQIYYDVKDVEPWMSGNARGASTAFCLLYRSVLMAMRVFWPEPRLFTLAITEREVQDLLNHTDSPYIRAVGFLYLRYVGNPRNHWDWMQRYVRDEEVFDPSPEGYGKSVTMGDFVRDVFLEQYYFETIFPRVPKPIQDNFVSKLTSMGLPSKAIGNGGQGGTDRRGIEEPNRRPASVKASLSVAFGQRAPNRSSAREEGRGLGAGMRGALGAGGASRSTPPTSSREAEPRRETHAPAGGRDSDRTAARPAARDDHDRDRDRHANGAGPHARDRDRDRDGIRHGQESDRRRNHASHRDRHDTRHDGERDRDWDRDRHYKRHRSDYDSSRGHAHDSRDHNRHRRQ